MDENTENSEKLTAAAARREARIKKILGESKNRLNKIAGKEENGKYNIVLLHYRLVIPLNYLFS